MSGIHAVDKPISGRTKVAGGVTMAYTFCCAVCGKDEVFSANNIDQAMNFALEEGRWRLSGDKGWVHPKCHKQLRNIRF